MIKGVIIKKIAKNVDRRGWLAEIYRQDESAFRPVMTYVSFTKLGMVRGPHEHKWQSDCFIFIGPGNFELHLWDKQGEHLEMTVGENNPVLVIVPPGVVHGYKCISESGGLYVNLPDKLYRGQGRTEEADEIRWEDDLKGKYKIN